MTVHDNACLAATSLHANTMVSWYLMASYAYYIQNDSILSDAVFDGLAKSLKENWGTIEHQHKHLITEGDLIAGTLLLAEERYPRRVLSAIESLRAQRGRNLCSASCRNLPS